MAPATKGGLHFLARRAVVWFYTNWRLLSIHRRPTTTLAPKGETTHYDLCVALLLQIMFAVHARGASNLSPLSTFGPAGRQPSSPIGACHNPIAKPPGLSSRGFMIPFPSGGKGQGLYPHITVLHISSHPAWRDEGGVIGEARLFSGLPWPGVRGGILQPVSFPP